MTRARLGRPGRGGRFCAYIGVVSYPCPNEGSSVVKGHLDKGTRAWQWGVRQRQHHGDGSLTMIFTDHAKFHTRINAIRKGTRSARGFWTLGFHMG